MKPIRRRNKFASFPKTATIPPDVLNGLQIKLSELTLQHPRAFGDCWLGCRLWDELQLDAFWRPRLPEGKAEVPLVQSARIVDGAPTGGSGQQVAFAPPVVSVQRDGSVAGGGLRGGGQEPAL